MSIKTTQRITREKALKILSKEIQEVPNDLLAVMLDLIADSGQSNQLSKFDNFEVSMFVEEQ